MVTLNLQTPISIDEVQKLNVGDTIHISGTIVTIRDEGHKRLLELHEKGEKVSIPLEGLAIYHCGPVVKKNEKWEIVAAGPTTSMRMESFADQIIEKFNVRVIIGKGGMGKRTTEAMKKYGAIYAVFVGGAAVLAAKSIKKVKNVKWLDLGIPEAFWILEVTNFGPLIVAIDTRGKNIFEDVEKTVSERKKKLYEKSGL